MPVLLLPRAQVQSVADNQGFHVCIVITSLACCMMSQFHVVVNGGLLRIRWLNKRGSRPCVW